MKKHFCWGGLIKGLKGNGEGNDLLLTESQMDWKKEPEGALIFNIWPSKEEDGHFMKGK